MYSSAYTWAKVVAKMEESLGAAAVSAWFDDTEVLELTESKAIMLYPKENGTGTV